MKFTYDELVKVTEADVLQCSNTSGMFTVSTDSRNINDSNVYLPLKGEKFDGHDFIKDAVDKGVRGYFTSDKNKKFSQAKFILYVPNTLEAYDYNCHNGKLRQNNHKRNDGICCKTGI